MKITFGHFRHVRSLPWKIECSHHALKEVCHVCRFFVRWKGAIAPHVFCSLRAFLQLEARRFTAKRAGWKLRLVGTQDHHTSLAGLTIPMHGRIEECRDADLVFFASGPDTRTLCKDHDYLQRFALDPQRQVIGSMCSGALLPAGMGLLDGLTATTYPTAVDALRAFGVTVVSQSFVSHGRIATAAGCLAAIELVGWMLSVLDSPALRDEVLASVAPVGEPFILARAA